MTVRFSHNTFRQLLLRYITYIPNMSESRDKDYQRFIKINAWI
jgi:hypothetical protein